MSRQEDVPKFLFCMSVRAGVFILSFTSAALSGVLTAIAWIAISRSHAGMLVLGVQQQVGVLVLGGSAPAFSAVFVLGFTAAATARRTLVSAYAWTSIVMFLLSFLVGALVLVGVLQPSTASADGLPTAQSAPSTLAGMDGQTLTGIIVVFWFVQLFGCFNMFSYRSQLASEVKGEVKMHVARQPITISLPAPDSRYASAAFM